MIRLEPRPVKVTLAQLKRAIQAIRAAGLYVISITARGEEYRIETSDQPALSHNGATRKPTPVL